MQERTQLMNIHSAEIQKLLAAVTAHTIKGQLIWEVLEYDPIGFMTEMGVEFDGSETENFAQNITFRCNLKKGRTIWLETYESIGFPSQKGFPSLKDPIALRGLAYYTLRLLSESGQVLYQSGSIIKNRADYLPLCRLADAVFRQTRSYFAMLPRQDTAAFRRYLRCCDAGGSLEQAPFSILMQEFYRHNRCQDFHLLAMTCTTGLHKSAQDEEKRSGPP